MGKMIILESPNKIHSVKEAVGDDYDVRATAGHIWRMKLDQGVDFETYKPLFEFQPSEGGFKSKKTLMKEIDTAATTAETIFIATDPDREGEVIADNIFQSLSKSNQGKVKRIAFDAITKSEILKAIENPRKINDDEVQSGLARRVLDRLIGYPLSNYLHAKIPAAISGGRVQSVILILLGEREEAIKNFVQKVTYGYEFSILPEKVMVKLASLPKSLEMYFSESAEDESESLEHHIKFKTLDECHLFKNKYLPTNEFICNKKTPKPNKKAHAPKPFTNPDVLGESTNQFG
ncbi:hypothetical protein FACS1894166_10230 [Bacilli bacterium]|nr:hypothetical protein FACS1894166_10230 [Bacilli bacterium]